MRWLICTMLLLVAAAPEGFSDLLAQAKAQSAAGHPTDMVNTVQQMLGMLSTATPDQLDELSALIEPKAPAIGPTWRADTTEQAEKLAQMARGLGWPPLSDEQKVSLFRDYENWRKMRGD